MYLFRHASVFSTYLGHLVSPSVGWFVILSDFHSVSVSQHSQSVDIVVADMVADMAADMELHMVADIEVDKVAGLRDY